ncbi:hypothetical protein ACIQMR_35215 [Streptomyces sp. NPDC091376]|uniref:deoxynucleotide monophosphate kinase family protein n=1 Tax=Streptomyces sp. NPDC091376 TaxID=3365994 RepID=UPI0037F5F430
MGNIGIIGRARVGKDTAGAWFVANRGYRRVGFADALKEAALRLDPAMGEDVNGNLIRLSDVLDSYRVPVFGGRDPMELVKDNDPEFRRILQELGAAIRAIDEDFWLRAALKKVQEANEAGVPCVITDVRYPNEAAALKRAGFHLVYVDRPGVPQMDHASENSLTADDADYTIENFGFLEDYLSKVERFALRVEQHESRRHFARL